MPDTSYISPKLSLAFAKLIAAPTADSWSQVYVAGNLFAALALRHSDTQNPEIILSASGKDILNNLEAEFFSLTDKNMSTVLHAVENTLKELPPQIDADACFAFFKSDILYLYIFGRGKIQIKRNGELTTVLEKTQKLPAFTSASGFLQTGDLILIQTDSFAKNTSAQELDKALSLELPNDIAENLAPRIEESDDGTQAAIIISYTGAPQAPKVLKHDASDTPPEPIPDEIKQEEYTQKNITGDNFIVPPKPPGFDLKPFLKKIKIPLPRLSLLQKISLIASVLIIIALISFISLSSAGREEQKNRALYNEINTKAQKLYDQGLSLKKLNNELAYEDFEKARSLLRENISKFPESSAEKTGLDSLLDRVENELKGNQNQNASITADETSVDENHIFNLIKEKKGLAYYQDETSNYVLTSDKALSISKTGGAEKTLINEKDAWDRPVSLSVYSGNIYILDKNQVVIKFVPAGSGYTKSKYFPDEKPSVSEPVDFAIDSAVWILGKDGSINKFVRGVREEFTIKGLPSAIGARSKIHTTADIDNLYVLDINSSRIIKISKEGQFISQFSSAGLGKALAFEITGDEQKALFLSGNKIYSIPLTSP